MKEYRERLKALGYDATVIDVVLRVLDEEKANLGYRRPPSIIQDIQRIIESAVQPTEEGASAP